MSTVVGCVVIRSDIISLGAFYVRLAFFFTSASAFVFLGGIVGGVLLFFGFSVYVVCYVLFLF